MKNLNIQNRNLVLTVTIFLFLASHLAFSQGHCCTPFCVHNLKNEELRTSPREIILTNFVKKRNLKLKEINKADNEIAIYSILVKIDEQGYKKYSIYNGSSFPIYSGNDFTSLVKQTNTYLPSKRVEKVYLDFINFDNEDKIEAFASSFRVQFAQKNSSISVSPLNITDESFDAFFLKKPTSAIVAEPVLVKSGKYTNFYMEKVSFWLATKKFTLKFYSKSLDTINSLFQSIKSLFSTSDYKNMTVSQLSSSIKSNLYKNHHLDNIEVFMEFEDEIGNTFIVELEDQPLIKSKLKDIEIFNHVLVVTEAYAASK